MQRYNGLVPHREGLSPTWKVHWVWANDHHDSLGESQVSFMAKKVEEKEEFVNASRGCLP